MTASDTELDDGWMPSTIPAPPWYELESAELSLPKPPREPSAEWYELLGEDDTPTMPPPLGAKRLAVHEAVLAQLRKPVPPEAYTKVDLWA